MAAQSDIVIALGIPVTSATRTVLDLIEQGEDPSLVSNAMCDALDKGLVDDEDRFMKLVDGAGRRGLPAKTSLYKMMAEKGL